ncbi:multidrug effflux MFS transporter [Ketogulonicigenium vulgare]|uniref:multidrug effflux MFS transporter n=1 Tax=Ketogulonicigenium vulgare TaxID=92945 RepID=UPI002359AC4A|nr:multidrug effflux MFS transporter [Ketogulonicigenium vulgare]
MPKSNAPVRAGRGFVVTIGIIAALGPLAIDMYLPSILGMAADLNATYASMQLSLTVFLLAMGAGQLVFGPIADAIGRRIPVITGLIVYIVMAAASAFSMSFEVLIVARTVQGLAAAVLLVVAMSSVRDVTSGIRAAQIFAMLMTVEGLAPIVAPVVGGVIGGSFGWRGVMVALAIFGLIVLLNTVFNFPETLPRSKRTSLRLKAVFGTYKEIICDSGFVIPGAALTSAFFFLFAYIGGAGYAYQNDFGLSVERFGYVFGATGVAVLVGAILAGKLVAHVKIQGLSVVGGLLMLLGALVAIIAGGTSAGLAGVVIGIAIAMLGLGIAEATLMSIAMSARDKAVGASVAVLGAFQLGVAGFATPIAGQLVEKGVNAWLGFLVTVALVTVVLSVISAYRSIRSGAVVDMHH